MDLSDLLQTLLAAMTPVGELRLSIPWAIYHLHMPWYKALPISIVGNMLPVTFLIFTLDRIVNLARLYSSILSRILDWWISRSTRLYTGLYRRHGALALIGLVAIPLPFTGAWTGSLVALAFRIRPRVAIPLIGFGVIISGILITVLTEAGLQIFAVDGKRS